VLDFESNNSSMKLEESGKREWQEWKEIFLD